MEPGWITSTRYAMSVSGMSMRNVDELERLKQAYGDALAAYRQVLATLDQQMDAGTPTREDIQRELDASVRLNAARRAYLDAQIQS
jgi:hypothetical protein